MCTFKSFIITRTDILHMEDSDRHEDIIKQHGLDDSTQAPDFVRVELVPDGTPRWRWKVDQDYLPDWWSAREAETACRAVVSRLMAAGKMHCPGDLDLNALTSLPGPGCLPKSVGGYLNLNALTSLPGPGCLPKSVGGYLNLDSLTSLTGPGCLPQSVGGSLCLNSLTSLPGPGYLPQSVGGDLYLDSLTSLDNVPTALRGRMIG